MEADSSGVPVRYFIWGGGMLLAVVEADGTVRYCHSDEQGSVVALTDSEGAVTDQYCYGPYGTDWGHSGTNSIPFRWLGSHGVFNVGGSALHLTRYRAYDTQMGRFLSQDPIGLGGGPNLYAYCKGSPLAYIDPLGLGAEAPVYDDYNPLFAPFSKITGINTPPPTPGEVFLNNPSLETIEAMMNDPAMQMAIMMSVGVGGSGKFVSSSQLAQKLRVSEKTYHTVVKPQILKDTADAAASIGAKNPDIGSTAEGRIILKNVKTGVTKVTDALMEWYEKLGE
jgi:RHS repeat-associated protein